MGCLLLGCTVAILAWRRPNRRHRWARAIAGLVAAGMLWLLAFPPFREVAVAQAEAVLLTDNYHPDTLRQLQRRLGAGTPVWYYGSKAVPARARALASVLTLAEQQPALRRLHVLGQGLPAAELPALRSIPVQGHAGYTFVGFRAALWPEQVALGEVLRVEGSVEVPKGKAPVWVGLRAAGTVRDSVRLPAGQRAFRLRYQPKTTGLALYELVLRRAGKVLAREPLPVEISAPRLPAVLLLTATPSFEFKYLKNYLAEAHYPVALRTTVSRGLVQTDFMNQPALDLSRLTPALLGRYSVLVLDAATLAALSATEAQTLQAAISTGRLGLLTLAETSPLPRATPARADFIIQARAAAQAVPQGISWPDAPAGVQAPVPAQLRPAPALRSLVTGPGSVLLAASRRVGLSFVVVSVVPETFRWALQGRAPAYASFWNRLLSAAMPPASASASWHLGGRWPRPHHPLILRLAAAGLPETLPTVASPAGARPVRLALRQDTRIPEWSTAQFWPATVGWHEVRGPGRTVHNFYVYGDSAWQGPDQQERAQAAALRLQPGTTAASAATATVLEPWPAGWFFLLFLLAVGYLWLEEKL